VEATIKAVQQLLVEEAHLSSAMRSILEVMIMLMQIVANRLSLNSRNSSKPPSQNRFSKDISTIKFRMLIPAQLIVIFSDDSLRINFPSISGKGGISPDNVIP
jgi:hypothetical protein